jgi:predicted SpoU family rRNA methylase
MMNADTNGSYPVLKTEVLRFLHEQSVDGRIRAMVLDLVNQALRAQRVVLANTEKEALLKDMLGEILREMLAEYGEKQWLIR